MWGGCRRATEHIYTGQLAEVQSLHHMGLRDQSQGDKLGASTTELSCPIFFFSGYRNSWIPGIPNLPYSWRWPWAHFSWDFTWAPCHSCKTYIASNENTDTIFFTLYKLALLKKQTNKQKTSVYDKYRVILNPINDMNNYGKTFRSTGR